MKWSLILAIILIHGYAFAGDFYVNGSRKVVEFVDPISVYAVPSSQLGLQYYYRVRPQSQAQSDTQQLSEEDVERIAAKTAEKVILLLTEAIEKGNPEVNPASLDLEVEEIFKANCARCHNDSTKRGKFEDKVTPVLLITNDKLAPLTRDQREQIWDAVDTQRMPQDHDPLSVDQIDKIRQWWKRTPKTTLKQGE